MYNVLNIHPTMNYRVKIFSSFCDSGHAKRSVEELVAYRGNGRQSAPITIVGNDDDSYTHVVIWNTAMPSIPEHIPKENVIGFAYEPMVYLNITDAFVAYAVTNIHTYYVGDADGLPPPFVEGNAYLTYSPPRLNHVPMKHSCMSMIVSHKNELSGHMYRHALLEYILYHKLPIDIYGNGTQRNSYKGVTSDRIKGPFQQYEPYEGYLFSVCIENTQSNHYFSEKIINPLLSNTTPVYLGCDNIDTYFPNNVIQLKGDIDHDMNLLVNILRTPLKYRKNIDASTVEKRVSLVHNLARLYEANNPAQC